MAAPKNRRRYGFSLYYGALKGTPHKWIDIERAVSQVVDAKHDIKLVRYFTARVTDRDGDPTQSTRQDAFLQALTARGVIVHEGQFVTKPRWFPSADDPSEIVRCLGWPGVRKPVRTTPSR